jgi:hypothetical protein
MGFSPTPAGHSVTEIVDEITIAPAIFGLANRLLAVPSDVEAITYGPRAETAHRSGTIAWHEGC